MKFLAVDAEAKTEKAKLWRHGRFTLCGVAAFLNAVDLGFQGNGNLIWSGAFLGIVLGLAWSGLLLFASQWLVRGMKPTAQTTVSGAALLVFVALVAVMCVHLWGGRKVGLGPL